MGTDVRPDDEKRVLHLAVYTRIMVSCGWSIEGVRKDLRWWAKNLGNKDFRNAVLEVDDE